MIEPVPTLVAEELSLGYDAVVVPPLTLELPPGAVTVIVGANASGKSTLLRGLARILPPRSGRVLLDGEDLRSLPSRRIAQRLTLLPQQPIAPEGITVRELVERGRYPHRRLLQPVGRADAAAVQAALDATATADLADRLVESLSGGQRQRVWIAMALAQETPILLLDEPTTFLDIAHQVEVLDVLHELNRDRGTTVAMVLHDINLAARYADHLVVLAGGRVLASGAPADILTPDLVARAFALEVRIIDDPVSGTPLVVPIGRAHRPADPTPEPPNRMRGAS